MKYQRLDRGGGALPSQCAEYQSGYEHEREDPAKDRESIIVEE